MIDTQNDTGSQSGSAPGTSSRIFWLLWGLVGLAIALRLGQYLHNPAVWLDEAFLVVGLEDAGWSALNKPLAFGQSAPYVFLLVVKACLSAFGKSEFALRALPLAASLLSVLLFLTFARKQLRGGGLLLALALFAVSGPLIRYAAEIKQYGLDVFVALALYVLAAPVARGKAGPLRLAVLTVAGMLSVWCSFPAIFVLAGLGIAMVGQAVWQKAWPRTGWLCATGLAWLASFAAYYLFCLGKLSENPIYGNWWLHAFMPLPPTSFSDLKWFLEAAVGVFAHPVGLVLPGLGLALAVLGGVSLYRRDAALLWRLLLPIAFALLASGLHKYPFSERFLLFAAPMLFLLMGEGLQKLGDSTQGRLIPGVIAVLVLLQPSLSAVDNLMAPPYHEGIKPAMEYLAAHHRPGDAIYLHHWPYGQFRFYQERCGFTEDDYTVGLSARRDWAYYEKAIDGYLGSDRVWFAFVPVEEHLGVGEEQFFTTRLDALGERKDEFWSRGGSVYLYDLSEGPDKGSPAEGR